MTGALLAQEIDRSEDEVAFDFEWWGSGTMRVGVMGKTWITKHKWIHERDHMAELPAMAGLFEWSGCPINTMFLRP